MSKKPVFIPIKRKGYAHPKCFLSHTNDCSTKISKEHYISEALLNVIERHKTTIDVCGLSWLPKEKLKSIGKANLTAGILCTKHNSALAGLDSEIAKFVNALFHIDQNFQLEVPLGISCVIDGVAIERWILKMIVGLVESGQIKQKSGVPFSYKSKCIDLICSASTRWPIGWGMYFAKQAGLIHHSSSLELLPQHNPATCELLAITLRLNGFEILFAMGRPDEPQNLGVHRPQSMLFQKAGVASSDIRFHWTNRKVGLSVIYQHAGVYSGPAPTHDLPRLD